MSQADDERNAVRRCNFDIAKVVWLVIDPDCQR